MHEGVLAHIQSGLDALRFLVFDPAFSFENFITTLTVIIINATTITTILVIFISDQRRLLLQFICKKTGRTMREWRRRESDA